jgi:hypothetical protein
MKIIWSSIDPAFMYDLCIFVCNYYSPTQYVIDPNFEVSPTFLVRTMAINSYDDWEDEQAPMQVPAMPLPAAPEVVVGNIEPPKPKELRVQSLKRTEGPKPKAKAKGKSKAQNHNTMACSGCWIQT